MIPRCEKCGKKWRIVSAKANEPIYLKHNCVIDKKKPKKVTNEKVP